MRAFWTEERGGATIEWVVLTAVLVGSGTFMFDSVAVEVQALARQIETQLGTMPIPTSFAEFARIGGGGTL